MGFGFIFSKGLIRRGEREDFSFEDGLIESGDREDFSFNEDGEQDEVIATSYLGTPVISNLVFKSGSYIQDGKVIKYEGLRIDTVLITVNQTKNIVKTKMAGRNGTVKEYLSDGDYVISINGMIVNESGSSAYPSNGSIDSKDEEGNVLVGSVNAFIKLMRVPESLKFTSEFLDFIEVFDLTIESWSLPQVKGVRNQQSFSIKASSDRPIELQLNEEGNR